MNALLPLPVLLPMLAAGVKIVVGPRHPVVQRVISVLVLSTVVVVGAVLLVTADRHGPQTTQIGGWPAPVGITLIVDRLSGAMLTISAAVTLCVMIYAIAQDMADREPVTPLSVFHPTFLLLVSGVADSFLAGDLFNLFVGFEIMLTASYVLITLGGTPARIRAGMTYIMVALMSSMLFLVAIAVLYAATGTVNLAQLAVRVRDLPDGVARIAEVMLLVAFGVKAAVFPLSMWLPDSYPTAPAPVTAVFAGLLTKIGIYGMLRTETLLFPGHALRVPLLIFAFASMLVGVFGAMVQVDLNRLLSFTLVSHIGYMIFGLAMSTRSALGATLFYVLHHITIQTSLFLVAGLIERRGGSTSLRRLGGLARSSPLIGALFFVPAMNLGGIPPLSGFLGKLGLVDAGLSLGGPLVCAVVATALLTSLLTLYSLVKAWNQVFWRAPRDAFRTDEPAVDVPEEDAADWPVGTARLAPGMVGATVALIALSLAYTVAGGPLVRLTDRAADEMSQPARYIDTVRPASNGDTRWIVPG
ncbi:Na+/H+ antiporter subunit D [Actinomadura rayongensis]|uniref:Na+/H+ antiporter subunit D n=1 Tax=Actinomadura rayongensis TaxID=1429076 RepID=A0A6I4W1B5_9ACTN|nr:Na+/H+ antiporter subunit D [Actinomadura rayongensis]